MKRLTLTALAATAMILASGCNTVNKENIEAGAGWAEKYYNQPTVAEILHVEGTNLTLTVSGATKFVLSTPVPPKSIIPRDPTWYEGMFDTVRTIAPWIFMGWAIHDGAFGGATTTTSASTVNHAAAATP